MNIFPSPTESPLAAAEWILDVTIEQSGLTSQCIGVIKFREKAMCHISTVSESLDRTEAHRHVAEKARAWIAEYHVRRGDSQ